VRDFLKQVRTASVIPTEVFPGWMNFAHLLNHFYLGERSMESQHYFTLHVN